MSKFLFKLIFAFSAIFLISNAQAQSIAISASTSDTICSGTLVTFAAVASGVGSPHYQWLKNSVDVGVDSVHYSTLGLADGDVVMCELLSAPGGAILALSAPKVITVSTFPVVPAIAGSPTVCLSATVSLTDAAPGGVWNSSNPLIAPVSATGTVTGEVTGADTITYTVSNTCGTASANIFMTVNTTPVVAAITGAATLCLGGATVTYADATSGGTWSITNTTVAAIATGSTVHSIALGTDTVLYSLSNSCGSTVRRRIITVATTPVVPPISGSGYVCQGDTIHLADPAPGGNWRSVDNTIAAAGAGAAGAGGSTSVVLGTGGGATSIVYIVANPCGIDSATFNVTVNPLPLIYPILGNDSVCAGSTASLNEITTGGTWSSQNNAIATVDASGNVYGVASGVDSIYYSAANGCGTTTIGMLMAIYCPADAAVPTVNSPTAITIYPNPTADMINVAGIEPSIIQVMNVYGQLVKNTRNTASVSLNNLPGGVYYLTVVDENGNVVAKQNVVKR
jgi:hypothetical protein